MAKTEVILTNRVAGLGGEADQVKVSAGYARNYLFPQGLAIPLTGANKRRLEVLRQRRAEREAHELSSMTELSQALSKLTLVVHVKTGDDGKLFGAVSNGTIADELKNQFEAVVEKRKIHLVHPIKSLGEHEVDLRLHPEVTTMLKVRVESTNPTFKAALEAAAVAAAAQAKAVAEAKAKGRRERTDKPERPEKHEHAEKSERTGKTERPEKTERAEGKISRHKL